MGLRPPSPNLHQNSLPAPSSPDHPEVPTEAASVGAGPTLNLYSCQSCGSLPGSGPTYKIMSELCLNSPSQCPQYQPCVLSVSQSTFISLEFWVLIALGPRVSAEPTGTCKLAGHLVFCCEVRRLALGFCIPTGSSK